MRTNNIIGIALCAVVTMTGCIKSPDNGDNNGGLTKDQIFDYSTVNDVSVSVNYRLDNYAVLVEIFDINPMKTKKVVDGAYTFEVAEKRHDLEPVLRAITDNKGVFSGNMSLPAGVDKVYIYTDYPGVPHIFEVAVNEAGVSLDVNAESVKSRSVVTRSPSNILPKGMHVLGGWDSAGVPDYLLPSRVSHPEGLMFDISKIIPVNPYMVPSPVWALIDQPNQQNNLKIVKPTPVTIIFADENASMRNTLGYYCYPTGSAPASSDELDVVIAMPNLSYMERNIPNTGGMSSGDQLKLKYWNKQTQQFEDEFPSGVTIGFVVMSSAFNPTNTTVNPTRCFYTDNKYNTVEDEGSRQHVITFNDNRRNLIVFAMEDIIRKTSMTSTYPGANFRDAIFYVNGFKDGSVDTDGMNVLPEAGAITPPAEDNITVTSGTLIFEDLWPYEGDFDMNDVVIDYKCTVYRTANNRIIKLVDQYTPRHNGGKLRCGFGYQLKMNHATVAGVNITPAPDNGSTFVSDIRGLEREQNYATITLFDDLSKVVGKTYTVTVTFTGTLNQNEIVAPYNPFIVIGSDRGRGHELHMTNYEPTLLSDISLLGKGMDVSDASKGIYYISKNQTYPFAIMIPSTDGQYFAVPQESVRIDQAYPDFGRWVSSKGAQAKDWYKK